MSDIVIALRSLERAMRRVVYAVAAQTDEMTRYEMFDKLDCAETLIKELEGEGEVEDQLQPDIMEERDVGSD